MYEIFVRYVEDGDVCHAPLRENESLKQFTSLEAAKKAAQGFVGRFREHEDVTVYILDHINHLVACSASIEMPKLTWRQR